MPEKNVPQSAPQGGVPSPGRRRVLIWLGSLGLLTAGWKLWQISIDFLTPPVVTPPLEPVVAGPLTDFALNSLTFVPAASAWLGHDDGGFFAINAICPHLGCTVREASGGFECPCHGSQFSEDGSLRRGPASSAMSYLAVTDLDGILMIDTTKIVSAETRLAV